MATDPRLKGRLQDDELQEVVQELSQEETGVPLEDARAALRELDLPADRLEEAVEKVRARKAQAAYEAHTKKRKVVAIASAVALVLATVVGITAYSHNQEEARARITATSPTLSEETGKLKLSVKLMDAPKGSAVPMTCAWRTPEGTLLHENSWKTKSIDHDAWETHCVLNTVPDHVQVEMRAYDRVVAKSSK